MSLLRCVVAMTIREGESVDITQPNVEISGLPSMMATKQRRVRNSGWIVLLVFACLGGRYERIKI